MSPSVSVVEKILALAASLPEGEALRAKSLLHFGSRAAVDQALSRLVRQGELLRAGRGVYLRPVRTRFGTRYPEAGKIVEAVARTTGETVAGSAAAAANALGLTTQVPVRSIYATSGKTRSLKLGLPSQSQGTPASVPMEIELRHAPRWQLVLAGRPAGEVIRAIAWAAGESVPRKRGRPSLQRNQERAAAAERTLREAMVRMPEGVLEELASVRPMLPSWIAEPVSRMMTHG